MRGRSPPEEVPVNQSSISCNDQAGQNLLVVNNDSIQQITQFPPSFPQTMNFGKVKEFLASYLYSHSRKPDQLRPNFVCKRTSQLIG
ncbi:hypothetical protein SADUNF_Sadunf19G0028100 [Salix dunnii]|uniref:Uncharacterized protein n=1 Tax=Salix dunnii TaxID=1413687 RepID=A0A835MCB9_9ROSI|nr:hypothetical protein SADUNF_Sadunf19G0028100 [Salix dunnii]